ncbi:hypothetical protein AB1Y20_009244 [Prymnesium parvum]|uniref:Centrosomal protein of 162 kDa n=1 Tax=Prymnesium parvum TaxID=97485 RepID=A0AB34K053_PRYPA
MMISAEQRDRLMAAYKKDALRAPDHPAAPPAPAAASSSVLRVSAAHEALQRAESALSLPPHAPRALPPPTARPPSPSPDSDWWPSVVLADAQAEEAREAAETHAQLAAAREALGRHAAAIGALDGAPLPAAAAAAAAGAAPLMEALRRHLAALLAALQAKEASTQALRLRAHLPRRGEAALELRAYELEHERLVGAAAAARRRAAPPAHAARVHAARAQLEALASRHAAMGATLRRLRAERGEGGGKAAQREALWAQLEQLVAATAAKAEALAGAVAEAEVEAEGERGRTPPPGAGREAVHAALLRAELAEAEAHAASTRRTWQAALEEEEERISALERTIHARSVESQRLRGENNALRGRLDRLAQEVAAAQARQPTPRARTPRRVEASPPPPSAKGSPRGRREAGGRAAAAAAPAGREGVAEKIGWSATELKEKYKARSVRTESRRLAPHPPILSSSLSIASIPVLLRPPSSCSKGAAAPTRAAPPPKEGVSTARSSARASSGNPPAPAVAPAAGAAAAGGGGVAAASHVQSDAPASPPEQLRPRLSGGLQARQSSGGSSGALSHSSSLRKVRELQAAPAASLSLPSSSRELGRGDSGGGEALTGGNLSRPATPSNNSACSPAPTASEPGGMQLKSTPSASSVRANDALRYATLLQKYEKRLQRNAGQILGPADQAQGRVSPTT